MNPSPRKAERSAPKRTTEKASDNIRLEPVANQQLTAHAKKLKMSKTKYASAAIAFFAESGLDPTAERPGGLADVNAKVSIETLAVRRQNADIGNRLMGIMRTWEKSLYGFLQEQQAGTLSYLEQIENNIIQHQVAVESELLAPMVELIISGSVEAQTARLYGVRTHLHVTGKKEESAWAVENDTVRTQRINEVKKRLREFIETNNVNVSAPGRASKPEVPEVPKVVLSVPTPVAPAPGVAPK
jgi:hypothetical protein